MANVSLYFTVKAKPVRAGKNVWRQNYIFLFFVHNNFVCQSQIKEDAPKFYFNLTFPNEMKHEQTDLISPFYATRKVQEKIWVINKIGKNHQVKSSYK